jgi:Tol biopolymer transport system component
MHRSDHKLDGASRLSRNARTGALTACGVAAVVGLASMGSPAQASFPGLNGKVICSGSLATELEPLPLPPGQSRLELFSINPDGTGETRLMQNTNSDFSPRYSADGTKVAWVRDNDIWTMNADGSNQVGPLTDTRNNTFMGDWSPDGTQLVFQSSRDGNFEVYKMNADGSEQVNLTNNATPGRNNDSQPAWSPDGTKIAFQSNRDGNSNIHVMDADGSNVVNLTGGSLAEESAPRWSPDGSMIAFQSDRDAFPRPGVARNLEIYRMNADGSGATRLTFNDFDESAGPGTLNLTGFDLNPAWSPDGTRIVFHSGRAPEFRDTGAPGSGIVGQWEAYHVDAVNGEVAGGSALVRLTTRPGNDERCDWQPLRVATAPPPAAPVQPPSTPPPPPPAAVVGKLTAKLSLARATINRRLRVLDVLAPITARASGNVRVQLHAAGERFRFNAPIDAENGRIRFRQRIPAAQARRGTGIITITYAGDADTRPQTVRLRAANRAAQLRLSRPRLVGNRLQASGTVSSRARGVVRLQVEYDRGGQTQVLRFRAQIRNGRWSLNETLSATDMAAINQRNGTLHSYTLFTGYEQANMRGEMRSFQILGNR